MIHGDGHDLSSNGQSEQGDAEKVERIEGPFFGRVARGRFPRFG